MPFTMGSVGGSDMVIEEKHIIYNSIGNLIL
jgi:hypothetical protein